MTDDCVYMIRLVRVQGGEPQGRAGQAGASGARDGRGGGMYIQASDSGQCVRCTQRPTRVSECMRHETDHWNRRMTPPQDCPAFIKRIARSLALTRTNSRGEMVADRGGKPEWR